MSGALESVREPISGRLVRAGGISVFVASEGNSPALAFLHCLGRTYALWRQFTRL